MNKREYKKYVANEHRLNSCCNTLISTLFLVLIALFGLFVCDLTGVVHLNQPFQYVNAASAEQETNPDLTFISASQTNTFEPALVGQEQQQQQQQQQQKQQEIIKPLIDHREYKYIELPNKLKVLLIHDKNSEIAQAALDVRAGSWNEPDEYPGLAHFCEHMLFIGSQKYPDPGYFDEIMARGGGFSNAYTEATNTNYYFEVTVDQLGKALDAFAHFFIDPLFSEEAVNKERNAVNSEYEIDVNTEDWKVVNLFSLLAKSAHPASRFSIGNNDVLNKPGVVDALKQFYQDNYSANLMAFSLQSSLPIEAMEKVIKSGAFKNIPNKQLTIKQFNGFPYEMGQIGKFQSTRKQFIYNWQLSGRDGLQHSKPLEFLDYFVSSNHEGGLKDYLLKSQEIIQLESSVFIEEKGFVNYVIELTLPDRHLDDGNKAVEMGRVINNYFQQLGEWLKDEKYMKAIFDEQSQVSKINFEYMEGQQEMSALSKNLNKYNPSEVLSAQYVMDKFDKDQYSKYINELKKTENLLILVSDNEYVYNEQKEKLNNKQFLSSKFLHQKSDLYHLQYDLQKLSKDTAKYITNKDKKLQSKFSKPPNNEFIPTDLTIVSLCQSNNDRLPPMIHHEQLQPLNTQDKLNLFYTISQELQDIENDQDCQAEELTYQKNNHYPTLLSIDRHQWWKISTTYKLPTVYGALQYKFTQIPTLQEFTSLRLYNYLIEDQIQLQLNQALNSGYQFNLDLSRQMEIKIYGFSEKIRNFFKHICSCMNPFKEKSFLELNNNNNDNESIKFNIAKQSLITSIKEIQNLKLFEQAIQLYLNQLTRQQFYKPMDILTQVNDITQEQMLNDVKKFLKTVNQNSLLIGNINQQQAKEISDDLQQCAAQQITSDQVMKEKIINLNGQNLVFAQFVEADQGDINGATLNYYQIGQRTQKNYAIMKVLQPMLNNQAYSSLRTEQQLGYVVAMRFKHIGCVDGAVFLVQGSKELPHKVDTLIEEFLGQFKKDLNEMSKKEFQHQKHSAIVELRENPQSLSDEGDKLWEYISTGDIMFEEKQASVDELRKLKKKEVLQFYEDVFLNNRKKLSIQLYGEGMMRETMGLKTNEEFNTYIQENMTKEQKLYDSNNISYYECENDVTQI